MIGALLKLGSEIVEVRVNDKQIFFRNSAYGNTWADFDGIKLDKKGVIKEFPDLENDGLWESKARERFIEKVSSLPTEEKRIRYIIDDLKKFGYTPLYLQKQGFRPQKII